MFENIEDKILDAMEAGRITYEDAEDMLEDVYDAKAVLEASKEEADRDVRYGRTIRDIRNEVFRDNPDSIRIKNREKYLSSNHDPKGSDYKKYKKDIRKAYSFGPDGWGSGDTRGKKIDNYELDDNKKVRSHRTNNEKKSSYMYLNDNKQPSEEFENTKKKEKKYRDKLYKKRRKLSDEYEIADNKKEADKIRANGKKATHSDTYYRISNKIREKDHNSYNREHEAFKKLQIADGLITKVKEGKITGASAEKIKKRYPKDFEESVEILREETMNNFENGHITLEQFNENNAILDKYVERFYE